MILVCFSDNEWGADRRLQQLMLRAADRWTVYFYEPRVRDGDILEPEFEVHDMSGVKVIVTRIPLAYSEAQAVFAEEAALDRILDRDGHDRVIFWYRDATALPFSIHREPDLCVYDWAVGTDDRLEPDSRLFDVVNLILAPSDKLDAAYLSVQSRSGSRKLGTRISECGRAAVVRPYRPGHDGSWGEAWRDIERMIKYEIDWERRKNSRLDLLDH